MVSFQRTPKPRNYLSRREQWRLLLLVMSLGLAMLLMMEARKPQNWRWITALDEPESADAVDGAKAPSEREGTLFAPELRVEGPSGRYFRGVKQTYLKTVRDDTTFGPGESDAWFHLFAILNNNEEETLRQGSSGRVTRAQLFEQSTAYRGELVTVAGTVRRVFRLTAPQNDYGVPGYYQVWLQPDDNLNAPIVVYCLYLPQGFPTGMDLDEQALITGFYFKRWPYKAVKTIEIAPTLLARTIQWRKRPEMVKEAPRGPGSLLLVVGAALAFSVLVTAYVYYRTLDRAPVESESPPDLDALVEADDAIEPNSNRDEHDGDRDVE